jgi:hypothetical protein
MKDKLILAVALIGLVLPWLHEEDEVPAPHRSHRVPDNWDFGGMPANQRYEDWS